MNAIAEGVFSHLDKSVSFVRDHTVLLCIAGSRAYGTHTPDSDFDYKGCCVPPKRYYIGNTTFEQAEIKKPKKPQPGDEEKPDTTIFELRKAFNLCAAANPNTLEMLFTDPSDQIIVDPIGEVLIDNRHKFLSKRIKHSAVGYAVGQLRKMQQHRQYLLNPVKEPPTRASLGLPERTLIPQDQLLAASASIQKELDRFNFDFIGELQETTKIEIRNIMAEMLAEYRITTEDMWMSAARKTGLSDNFIELMQREREYINKKRDYEKYLSWKAGRNKSRAADEEKFGYSGKFAVHLVRLIRMARECLQTGNLIVKRPDAEELLAIRNGAWKFEEIVEYAQREDKALDELYRTSTVLPHTPDHEFLNELCMSLIEKSLSRYSWHNARKWLHKLALG